MMDYDYLHEVEEVILLSDTKRPCDTLWSLFESQGFTLHDDVFSFDRPMTPPPSPWQAITLIAVHIFDDEIEIYDSDGQWNKVVLKYLLATQPRSGIATFSKQASSISVNLG